jgi:hypothetical protein
MAGTSTVPTTSYLSSTTNTLLPKAGMDPLIGASLIGGGASLISGGIGASGSKKAADKAKQAAETQARAIEKASREAPLLGFGTEVAAKEFDRYIGGPMERANAFDEAKLTGALSFSPNTLARERMRLSQELAGIRQQAYGKEMDPFRRFI